jgi:hypothetical protein
MSVTQQRSPEAAEVLDALRAENDQLRTALRSRIIIEQAKGMLAERLDVHVDEAFERLRREARNRRMRLHALCAAVVAREPWADILFRWPRDANAEAPRLSATERNRSSPTASQPSRSLSQVASPDD